MSSCWSCTSGLVGSGGSFRVFGYAVYIDGWFFLSFAKGRKLVSGGNIVRNLDRIDGPQEFHHFYHACQLFLPRPVVDRGSIPCCYFSWALILLFRFYSSVLILVFSIRFWKMGFLTPNRWDGIFLRLASCFRMFKICYNCVPNFCKRWIINFQRQWTTCTVFRRKYVYVKPLSINYCFT